jgi:ribosomal protein L31E
MCACLQVVTREYSINMHKRIHGIGFKYRAKRAIGEIRKFARQQMGTEDVRVDTKLNKFVWSRGIRYVRAACVRTVVVQQCAVPYACAAVAST